MLTRFGDLKPGTYEYESTESDYLEVIVAETGSVCERRVRWDGVEPEPEVSEIAELKRIIDEQQAQIQKFTSVLAEKGVLTPEEKKRIEAQKEREAKEADPAESVVKG